MSREREFEEVDRRREESAGAVVVAEAVRLSAPRQALDPGYLTSPSKSEERIPLFWRLFGGTLLSIVALICLTVYNQFTSSISDLRREIVQLQDGRVDLIKKDELNGQLTKLWNGFKELQVASSSLGTLNERLRLMEQQIEKQLKTGEEDRKELRGKLEELRKAHQVQGEEFRKVSEADRKDWRRDLEDVRKNADVSFKELARKIDEQFKAAQEERKDLHRKFEEQIKILADERRETTQKLQALAERLATVEGRQTAPAAEKKVAAKE